MDQSCSLLVRQFKSPIRVVAAVLLRSRNTQARRARAKALEIERLRRDREEHRRLIAELRQELADDRFRRRQLEAENDQLRQQPPVLPDDPPLPHHEFGPQMMAVCVNLARAVGLRRSTRCLEIVFDWLGVTQKIPDWTSVRIWLMRVGVAAVEDPVERADDWVWMADHSNQIGQEKTLVVLGIRASLMPPPGTSLTHADVRTLLVQPGTDWKREDMADAYQELAARIGAPRAVLVDGAVELRDGAAILQEQRPDSIVLGDLKPRSFQIPCRERAEESRRERRAFYGIPLACRTHSIVGAADGTGSSDAAGFPSQGSLHESGCDSEVGEHGVVALEPSELGRPPRHHHRSDERETGLAQRVPT